MPEDCRPRRKRPACLSRLFRPERDPPPAPVLVDPERILVMPYLSDAQYAELKANFQALTEAITAAAGRDSADGATLAAAKEAQAAAEASVATLTTENADLTAKNADLTTQLTSATQPADISEVTTAITAATDAANQIAVAPAQTASDAPSQPAL